MWFKYNSDFKYYKIGVFINSMNNKEWKSG